MIDALKEISDTPAADKELIGRWAEILGLRGIFHFESHLLS